jgi:5'-methylthioadenosine phosphorylase
MRVGIVGGTGIDAFADVEVVNVETPWGDVSVRLARYDTMDVAFLARHGGSPRPAHVVGHRANVDALARCRVDRVLALNTVGALVDDVAPGSFVVPDDYLDLRARRESFFDDAPVHIDVTEAYCPEVRRALVDAARAESASVIDGGVYAATEGPRLETRAEVRALRQLGGTVVGMTGCPEAALARERRLCYASLCLVTNPAAGVGGARPVAEAIRAGAKAMAEPAMRIALRAAAALPAQKRCACARALDEARI